MLSREIVNRIAGRKKQINKSVTFNEIIRIFSSLKNTKIPVKVNFTKGVSQEKTVKSPEEVMVFLKREFYQSSTKYFIGAYETYVGLDGEKNYIDILEGSIIRKEDKKMLEEPYKKAILEFFVESTKLLKPVSA